MAEACDPTLSFNNLIETCESRLLELGRTNPENEIIQTSKKVIEDLNIHGFNLIRNVQSSSAVRRERENSKSERLIQQCASSIQQNELETNENARQLEHLWQKAHNVKVPEELQKELQQLQGFCNDILSGQDSIIADLTKKLEDFDETFHETIGEQTEDLTELRKRMSQHTQTMREGYRKELQNIDMALTMNFEHTLAENDHLVQSILGSWSRCEDFCLDQFFKNAELWQRNTEQTEEHYYKETNELKKKLMADIQKVEEEVEKVKSATLLNNEILDYNCQILKTREEEHAVFKAQQKRRINRLADQCRLVKSKCEALALEQQDRKQRILRDIEKSERENEQLLLKVDVIRAANQRKMEALWRMNQEAIDDLIKQISTIHDEIGAKILGKRLPSIQENYLKKVKEQRSEYWQVIRSAEEIRQYFQQVRDAIPEECQDLWKMLAKALMKYSEIMKDRDQLLADYLKEGAI